MVGGRRRRPAPTDCLGALDGEVDGALVGAAVGFTGSGVALGPGAVGGEIPRLAVVGEHDVEHFVEAGLQSEVFDGDGGFDAVVEVAAHPIGGTDVELLLAVVEEVEDAGVFKEAANDGDDADVFREAGNLGAEAAESAHDEIDFDAGGGGFVEGVDDFGVFESVHFGDDPGGFSGGGVFGFTGDHGEEAGAHGDGGDEKFAVITLEGAAGEEGEEIDDVLADVFLAGEEADIGVELRGLGIVVAGGDVDVAAEVGVAGGIILAADDERGFGVRFQPQ